MAVKKTGKTKTERKPALPTVPTPPSGTGTTGGGGSSGSSGSSGGSSSAGLTAAQQKAKREAKKQERQQNRVQVKGFLNVLAQWDVPLTKGLRALTKKAAKKDWTISAFQYVVRNTKPYKKRFGKLLPGVSEDQFLSYENTLYSFAAEYGLTISPKLIKSMFKSHVTPETAQLRMQGIARAIENQQVFQTFGSVAQAQGLIQGPLSLADMVNFSLGLAPNQWYKLWEKTALTYQAQAAGLGNLLTDADLDALMQRSEVEFTEQSAGELFTDLANKVRSLVPRSRLAGMGVSERSIVEMELNPLSPEAQRTAATLDQAIANLEAQAQQRTGTTPLRARPRKQQATV